MSELGYLLIFPPTPSTISKFFTIFPDTIDCIYIFPEDQAKNFELVFKISFFSHSVSNLSANPLCSFFKLYPDSDHLSPPPLQKSHISCQDFYCSLLTGLPAFDLTSFCLFSIEHSEPSKIQVDSSHSSASNPLMAPVHRVKAKVLT